MSEWFIQSFMRDSLNHLFISCSKTQILSGKPLLCISQRQGFLGGTKVLL